MFHVIMGFWPILKMSTALLDAACLRTCCYCWVTVLPPLSSIIAVKMGMSSKNWGLINVPRPCPPAAWRLPMQNQCLVNLQGTEVTLRAAGLKLLQALGLCTWGDKIQTGHDRVGQFQPLVVPMNISSVASVTCVEHPLREVAPSFARHSNRPLSPPFTSLRFSPAQCSGFPRGTGKWTEFITLRMPLPYQPRPPALVKFPFKPSLLVMLTNRHQTG